MLQQHLAEQLFKKHLNVYSALEKTFEGLFSSYCRDI
jgi:hypothetical protein